MAEVKPNTPIQLKLTFTFKDGRSSSVTCEAKQIQSVVHHMVRWNGIPMTIKIE